MHVIPRLIGNGPDLDIFRLLIVQTGLFINNEFVGGSKTIDTINPANGEVIASVQAGK
jgi:hypothetical protein